MLLVSSVPDLRQNGSMELPPPPQHIIERLIEVTVDLHEERGDREALLRERQRLLHLAKELKLIPSREDRQTA